MQGMLSNFRAVLHGRLLIFLVILTVFSLGAFNFAFILVESSELGLEIGFVPLVYVVINVAHTAIGYPSGILADRFGHEKILLVGFAMFSLTAFIGFISPEEIQWAFIMAIVFGTYYGITITNERAIVSKYSSELKGTAFGVYYLVIGVSFFIANFVFGHIWDTAGSQAAFSYSLTTSLIGICGMILLIFWKRK